MLAPATESVAVGLGDLLVRKSGELVAYSLGSCVAICLYDPLAKVAAMAHVVLPAAPSNKPIETPGRFADTAVPALIDQIQREGGSRLRLQCRLAGGAAVLSLGGSGKLPNIGQRNAEAVKAALESYRIQVLAESLGGTQGRTVRMDAASGKVRSRTVTGQEQEL
jgi:chemotaxis protein CheD